MGVARVITGALTHAETLEVSDHCFIKVRLSAQESVEGKNIQAVEAIQRTFTYKMHWSLASNYWGRLQKLKLYSLSRWRERYITIYIWKITQHMVPNIEGTEEHKIKTRNHRRHGTQCIMEYSANRNHRRHGTQCIMEYSANRNHRRHGTQCIMEYSANRNPAQLLQENEYNCIWVLLVQLVAEISWKHEKY